jgi:uncharacterized membrane protein
VPESPVMETAVEAVAKRLGTSVGPRTIRGRIVAGVLIIIPLAVTAFVIRYVYAAALSVGVWLVYLVSKALYLLNLGAQPTRIDPSNAAWHEITIAVVLTVLMLYLLGWLGTNVAGRRIIELFEALLERIPLVDTLYTSVKRMVQALSGSGKSDGIKQSVVLIDFPHEHMMAIGFMTNTVTDKATGQLYATVFVPTTPNPTSGYMEIVPIERVRITNWSMEEALTTILSGGASSPDEVTLRPGQRSDVPAGSHPTTH